MGQDVDCLVVEVGEAGKRSFQFIKVDFSFGIKILKKKKAYKNVINENPIVELNFGNNQ